MKRYRCENCRFWAGDEINVVAGCHRKSPVPYGSDRAEIRAAYWPLTDYDDWCAEWQMRDANDDETVPPVENVGDQPGKAPLRAPVLLPMADAAARSGTRPKRT